MKKKIILILLSGLMVTVSAQKKTSKKIETVFIELPSFDISITNPNSVKGEFVTGETIFETDLIKSTKSTCVPRGGGLKDAFEVTTYYYKIIYTTPHSYLVVKDPTGKIVYASEISEPKQNISTFGYNKCENWVADNLKKTWDKNKKSYKGERIENFKSAMHQKAIQDANDHIFLSFINEEFKLFSAKGKDFNYADLDKAFDNASKAFRSIKENGPNEEAFTLLKESIIIWEKALEESNVDDKKAKINKQITIGLHKNCANAYMYIYKLNEALTHSRKAQALAKNWFNRMIQNSGAML